MLPYREAEEGGRKNQRASLQRFGRFLRLRKIHVMDKGSDDGMRAAMETLVLAIAEDAALSEWFHRLGRLPSNLRSNAVLQIVSAMTEADEDADLISALQCLEDPSFHHLVSQAIAELL